MHVPSQQYMHVGDVFAKYKELHIVAADEHINCWRILWLQKGGNTPQASTERCGVF